MFFDVWCLLSSNLVTEVVQMIRGMEKSTHDSTLLEKAFESLKFFLSIESIDNQRSTFAIVLHYNCSTTGSTSTHGLALHSSFKLGRWYISFIFLLSLSLYLSLSCLTISQFLNFCHVINCFYVILTVSDTDERRSIQLVQTSAD